MPCVSNKSRSAVDIIYTSLSTHLSCSRTPSSSSYKKPPKPTLDPMIDQYMIRKKDVPWS